MLIWWHGRHWASVLTVGLAVLLILVGGIIGSCTCNELMGELGLVVLLLELLHGLCLIGI